MLSRNRILYLFMSGWHYAGSRRYLIVIYLVLMVFAQAASLTEPYLIGQALNAMQTSVANAELAKTVLMYLGLYFAAQIVFWVFHGPARVIERYVAFHIRVAHTKSLFGSVTELPLKWHREHHSGESIDKIKRATNALSEFMSGSFEFVYLALRVIGSAAVLMWYFPLSGVVAFVFTIVAFGIIYYFDQILHRHYLDLNKTENTIASAIHDYTTNIVSVITLRLESRVLKEVVRRIYLLLPVSRQNFLVSEIKWFFANIVVTALVVVVLGFYSWDVAGNGQIMLAGTFFTLFEYLRRIGDTFFTFAYKYGEAVRQAASVEGAASIEAARGELIFDNETYNLPSDWRELRIQGLNFVYDDEEKRTHHLRDLAFSLKKGESVAIIGQSGSGKSTLLSVLRGLHQTTQGQVLCDGKPLKGGLKHLTHHSTLLPQDPEIFADTIRFNITFGVEASDSEVLEAIREAQFESVLERLPRGLETNVSEKGVNLSGGERQRLACARGIFFARDSEIILLDEATSSVDPTNERIMYENFLRLYRDRTMVSSLHKLHLLPLFNQIYVFVDGAIVEKGSFNELLDQKKVLWKMWQSYSASQTIQD